MFSWLIWIYNLPAVAFGNPVTYLGNYEADIYGTSNYGIYSVTAFKCHLFAAVLILQNVSSPPLRAVILFN